MIYRKIKEMTSFSVDQFQPSLTLEGELLIFFLQVMIKEHFYMEDNKEIVNITKVWLLKDVIIQNSWANCNSTLLKYL